MKVHLPDEIAHYEPELRYFFDSMVQKLHINRHKGFGEDMPLDSAMGAIRDEMAELHGAVDEESQFAVFMEAVDVANQAWLLALVVMRMTKQTYESETNRVD